MDGENEDFSFETNMDQDSIVWENTWYISQEMCSSHGVRLPVRPSVLAQGLSQS